MYIKIPDAIFSLILRLQQQWLSVFLLFAVRMGSCNNGGFVWLAGRRSESNKNVIVWKVGKTTVPMNYTNFQSGEPNNAGGKEDCVHMLTSFKWNDWKCSHKICFVCEYKN